MSACAYNAPVSVSPNLNVYSSYSEQIPGDYLLFVESDALQTVVRPTGMQCGAHNYPVDAREAFRTSVLRTIDQLVGNVQLVDRPVPATELGERGMIIVRAESLEVDLQFIPGFWSSTADVDAEITASASVDLAGDRLFGTSASGDGDGQGDAGGACEGGAHAVGRAIEEAMTEVLGQLGERMSNSPRLRRPAGGSGA